MAFNVRLMLNELMPLRRIQVRYPKSRTGINNIYAGTDNNGRVRIDRDDDPRGVEVEVYASNPVVGAVSGALNAQVSVMTRLHADEEMIVPRRAKDRDNFRMVEVARDIYNRTCRHFSPFMAEFPFPSIGACRGRSASSSTARPRHPSPIRTRRNTTIPSFTSRRTWFDWRTARSTWTDNCGGIFPPNSPTRCTSAR